MRKELLILSFCMLAGFVSAQSTSDFEFWLRAGGQIDLLDQLQLQAEQQIRFKENGSEVKNYHTEVALSYTLLKGVDVLFVNRFIRRNDNKGSVQGYESHYRYQLGARAKHRAWKFRFKHRLLFQERNQLGLTSEEGDVSRRFLRYQLATEYKIKNWPYDPKFKIEYFNDLPQQFSTTNDQLRLGIGTERKYDNLGRFAIEYLLERSLKIPTTEWTSILAFKYEYRF